MRPPAIVFDEVTFSYPGAPQPALDRVSLTVPAGAFTLVTGPTGGGKSTLLRAMNGLVPHFTGGIWSGRVEVEGRDTTESPPRRLADVVAFVPQDPGASFVLDEVEDELAYALENLGVPAPVMRRRVEETLDLLAIEPLRRRSVRELSGGERQRVAIAAALTPRPRVLVLDEPTSQLDPQGAEDVLAALQRLAHDLGVTVVAAEHRLERIAGFADLAIGCRGSGRVMAGGVREVLADLSAGPPVTRLGRALGWEPPPLTVREARVRTGALDLAPPPVARAERGPALVEATDLSLRFGARRALSGVDVELSPGEIAAVMGRNGSGKTTLLRCLAGVLAPESGRVSVAGRAPRPGIDVSLCPQTPEEMLFKDSALGEVVTTLNARARREERNEAGGAGQIRDARARREERNEAGRADQMRDEWARRQDGEEPGRAGPRLDAAGWLEWLGLADLAPRHPRDLSAGQRLLVAVAATAAAGAPALLLDEPTRGLDPEAKERLCELLRRLTSRGACALCATHDVELVAEVASRVILLAGGEVIADGPTAEVLGDSPVFAPQMARVFGPGWLTPAQVMQALVHS